MALTFLYEETFVNFIKLCNNTKFVPTNCINDYLLSPLTDGTLVPLKPVYTSLRF